MVIRFSSVFDIIISLVFVVIFSTFGILTLYFEMKEDKKRKENIKNMRGEKLN